MGGTPQNWDLYYPCTGIKVNDRNINIKAAPSQLCSYKAVREAVIKKNYSAFCWKGGGGVNDQYEMSEMLLWPL